MTSDALATAVSKPKVRSKRTTSLGEKTTGRGMVLRQVENLCASDVLKNTFCMHFNKQEHGKDPFS